MFNGVIKCKLCADHVQMDDTWTAKQLYKSYPCNMINGTDDIFSVISLIKILLLDLKDLFCFHSSVLITLINIDSWLKLAVCYRISFNSQLWPSVSSVTLTFWYIPIFSRLHYMLNIENGSVETFFIVGGSFV